MAERCLCIYEKRVIFFEYNIFSLFSLSLSFFFLIINFNHMLHIMTKNDIVK